MRRAEEALRKQKLWQGQMLADLTRAAADHIARSRERERERERMERERREARRRRKRERMHADLASVPRAEGVFVLLCGMALFAVAMFRPFLWWLIFPAFFLVQRGIRVLSARRTPQPGAEREPSAGEAAGSTIPGTAEGQASAPVAYRDTDPRDARVDLVCEKIRAELRTGPAAVRELLHRPEETIDALQKTCRELTRRERELRAVLDPREDTRLDAEHERLSVRLDSETDPIVRQRLGDARQALDQQRSQRAELATSAARFEAEHTRISFTLESIYTQMLRARAGDAASADVAGAGLRRSLERLAVEMGAVAEALEDTHAETMGVSPQQRDPLEADRPLGDRSRNAPDVDAGASPDFEEPPPGGGANRVRTR